MMEMTVSKPNIWQGYDAAFGERDIFGTSEFDDVAEIGGVFLLDFRSITTHLILR